MPKRTGTVADFNLDPAFPFLHDIEAPLGNEPPVAYSVGVKGWVLVPAQATVDSIRIEHGGRVELDTRERPDVEAALKGPRAVGFQQQVTVDGSAPGQPWELVVGIDGTEYRKPLPPVTVVHAANDAMRAAKTSKLARIEPLLRCPAPGATDDRACIGTLERDGGGLRCTKCGTRYDVDERRFNFFSGELREIAAITDTDNISAMGYDGIAEEIIASYPDGLILDNGSGAKGEYRDNVVYLEIADYESTDVLGVGESLPFADDTFDAVLSLAVLEHVRDPFRSAEEIVRVLKPAGKVYAAVPFLQPYHGYPSHYYNMSLQGLENLFDDGCTIDHSGTPIYGLPIWTLCWFLSRYVDGLPPKVAKKFGKMRIEDFVRLGGEFIDRDFVQQLSAETNHDLACVNYVVATKT